MKVGICGCGFVGNAILQFLLNQYGVELAVYDKYKNLNTFETLLESEILFVCLPTMYEDELKGYNMTEIDSTLHLLSEHSFNGIILLKSTVLPDYCSTVNNLYPNLKIIHNPEFLSAFTALEDFAKQKQIILGYTKQSLSCIKSVEAFYRKLFPYTIISTCIAEEAGLTKLACNSFYATKIQFFTEVYLLCRHMNISYVRIREMMLQNGWINRNHTTVPGHDNHISFGGACLPKDISAFTQYMMANEIPSDVLQAVINERNKIRRLQYDV